MTEKIWKMRFDYKGFTKTLEHKGERPPRDYSIAVNRKLLAHRLDHYFKNDPNHGVVAERIDFRLTHAAYPNAFYVEK